MDQNSGFILDGVYLKNGALILVAFMLLAIPNLHVYSSIGSYRVVSQSIKVNKNYTSFVVNEYNNKVMELLATPSVTIILGISSEEMAWLLANCLTQGCYVSKHVTKPYTKYDFSDFDN